MISKEKKKRIVIISPAYPYRGGQALLESHLYQTLTDLGYTCYTISYKLLYPALLFPGTTQYDNSKKVHCDHIDRIWRIINSINPLSWVRAARKTKQIDPHAVVVIWWMPFFGPALGTISYLVKKWTKSQVVFLIENYISHEERWFDKIFTQLTLRLADHFICESEYIFKKLSQGFPHIPIYRTTLPVYDWYDFKQFDKQQAKDFLGIKTRNVVLFFGYIRAYKGLDILIKAFNRLLAVYPDTTLLIVGECYEDKQQYMNLLAAEDLMHKTIFVNRYIANEDVEPYYKAADLVCLPYKSATQSGIVMMSYGFKRPVVTTNVGGLPELVQEGQTGVIVPAGQIEKIADGMIKVLNLQSSVNFEKNIEDFTKELGHKNIEQFFSAITT